MGMLTGYHLALAGADVTFLVRPYHHDRLSRPQKLYSFDDNTLKTYSGYEVLTDPAELAGTSFDFVVITLDGSALRAEAGQKVVDELGKALRGTTGVVLGSVGVDLRSWFLQRSGLADRQATNGLLNLIAYEVPPAEMPIHRRLTPSCSASLTTPTATPAPPGSASMTAHPLSHSAFPNSTTDAGCRGAVWSTPSPGTSDSFLTRSDRWWPTARSGTASTRPPCGSPATSTANS